MRHRRNPTILLLAFVAAALGPWHQAWGQTITSDQDLILAGAYGLAQDCAEKFPGQSAQLNAAFLALKDRNKRLVPLSAWERIAEQWANATARNPPVPLSAEMCEYYLRAAAEAGEFDQQIERLFAHTDRASSAP